MMLTEASFLIPLSFAVAVCSWGCGVAIRRFGARWGLIDIPNSRSSHATPTPRGGGVGIVIATVGALGICVWTGLIPAGPLVLAIVIGGSIIAWVSFLDDRSSLPAAVRLTVHAGVAMLAVWMIGPILRLGVDATAAIDIPRVLAAVLCVLWLVSVINGFNFMDGIDGIAGGQAIVSGTAWTIVGLRISDSELTTVGATVGAASAGFLVHNWAPARLFMGDVGSAFLGFVLAVIPLAIADAYVWAGPFGVILLWPFVFDTAWTLLRRAARRENLLEAHRSHLYQRLIRTGFGHAAVASLYLFVAAIGACIAIATIDVAHGAGALISYAVVSGTVLLTLVHFRERRQVRQ